MTSEVNDLLAALRDGTMSLEQVAQKFRERRWPRNPRGKSASYEEMAARTLEDPEPYRPNSYDDLVDAYDRGDITREQYGVLAGAISESKRAEDQEKAAEGNG